MAIKTPFAPVIAKTAKNVDLTDYKLLGRKVLLVVPREALGSKTLIYSQMSLNAFFEVVKVGIDVDPNEISIGDYVLINPDLPRNQIPAIEIEDVKFLVGESHEIMAVRSKDYIAPVVKESDGLAQTAG